MYRPNYGRSHALIIGIDDYTVAPPLRFAVNDAIGVRDALGKLGFEPENTVLLLNDKATRESLTNAFLSFSQDGCESDDRLVVFFAGHGHTVPSSRGQVGFLVPHDGDPRDLSTLIRWDELTRNADLIAAKHVLFLMDACYGGLAVNRAATPGSVRFLRDMLLRQSRQVLTAGKADEPVADAGGPLPDHSVFTGHLLEALAGKAVDNRGNLTANGIVSYVYNMVSRDDDSQQTPHYGYLQGDGDMIFQPRDFPTSDKEDEMGDDNRMVVVPVDVIAGTASPALNDLKELLSEERFRIKLFDYMAQVTRSILAVTAEDNFPIQGIVTEEGFVERLAKYDMNCAQLIQQEMLLGRWAEPYQYEALTLPLRRLAERNSFSPGSQWLLASRWYPVLLGLYSCGLGSLTGRNLPAFFQLLHSPSPEVSQTKPNNLLVAAFDGTGEFHDAFKLIPGRERNFVARSEHIFSLLQPPTDDVLFLGAQYDRTFDLLELLMSLEYGHLTLDSDSGYYWSPIGRFGWKGRHNRASPLDALELEANRTGVSWEPLKAGFFGSSLPRFKELAGHLRSILARVSW